MSTPAPPARLSPFPDGLLEPELKEQAIEFLLSLGLPYYIASAHLGRWAAYVGVELGQADYWAVGRRRFRPLE